MAQETGEPAISDTEAWRRRLSLYQRPNDWRSAFELVVTVLPLALAWMAMLTALWLRLYWLYGLMLLPAAGLLIRLFMIQHDCGHGAFFGNQTANHWVGRLAGVLTFTPYDYWRRSHAIHHATSGNLDRRGIGDIKTLTVREYFTLNGRGRLLYRLYRHPLVMFGVGPAYTFLIESRLPFGFMRKGAMPWLSTMSTNAGILIAAGLLIWGVGLMPFLAVHLPVMLLAATAGVWLFYVQHQFEATTWDIAANW